MSGYGNAGATDVLAAWKAKAVRWVWLPSRTWTQLRIPSAMSLVNAGALPDDLIALALKFATGTMEIDAMDPEAIRAYERFRLRMLMAAVVAIDTAGVEEDPEHRGEPLNPRSMPVNFTEPEELYALPPEDQSALQALVDRRRTIEQVTVGTVALIELQHARPGDVPSPDTARRAEEAARAPTTASVAGFRHEPGGDQPGADGGEVRPKA